MKKLTVAFVLALVCMMSLPVHAAETSPTLSTQKPSVLMLGGGIAVSKALEPATTLIFCGVEPSGSQGLFTVILPSDTTYELTVPRGKVFMVNGRAVQLLEVRRSESALVAFVQEIGK